MKHTKKIKPGVYTKEVDVTIHFKDNDECYYDQDRNTIHFKKELNKTKISFDYIPDIIPIELFIHNDDPFSSSINYLEHKLVNINLLSIKLQEKIKNELFINKLQDKDKMKWIQLKLI